MNKLITFSAGAGLLLAAACAPAETADTENYEDASLRTFTPTPLSISGVGHVEAAPDIAIVTGLIEIDGKSHAAVMDDIAAVMNEVQATADTADTEMSYTEIDTRDQYDEDCLEHNRDAALRYSEIARDQQHNKNTRAQIRAQSEQMEAQDKSYKDDWSKKRNKIRKLNVNRDLPEIRRQIITLEEQLESSIENADRDIENRQTQIENLKDGLKDIKPYMAQKVCKVTHISGKLAFTARINPAGRAPDFMKQFTASGVTTINLFGYDFSDYDAVYQEAAERAVEHAKAKAELIARGAGTDLLKVKSFYVSPTTRFGRYGPQSKVITARPPNYITIPAVYETVQEAVTVQEASTELVTIPPVWETVTETIVVQDASTELVTVPAEYQTVTETIVIQPQSVTYSGGREHVIPAVTKQVNRRVVKTPARTVERVVPAVTQQIQKRVIKTPASTQERVVPPVTKMETRRVVKVPAQTIEQAPTAGPELSGKLGDSNALRQSVLSGRQTVTVSAHMVFTYKTALDGVKIRP